MSALVTTGNPAAIPSSRHILHGQVLVTPEGEEAQEFVRGDLTTFPDGMSCTWKILKPIEKHYSLDRGLIFSSSYARDRYFAELRYGRLR